MIISGSLYFDDAQQREAAGSLTPMKTKRLNHKSKSKVAQEKHDMSSSDIESDGDDAVESIQIIKTPTFNGRRLFSSNTADDSLNDFVRKDNELKSTEVKYLIPMLLAQQKLEIMMKTLYKNQISIQKALNKTRGAI